MSATTARPGLLTWASGSLQRQLSLIAAVLILATSTLFLFVVVTQYHSSILKAHEQASLNVNLLLQTTLENAMVKRDLTGLQNIVARLGAQDNVTGVMIANPLGEVRFSSYPDMLYQTLADADFRRASDSGTMQSGFQVLSNGDEVLRSINPVHNKPPCAECHGAATDRPINGLLIVDYASSDVKTSVRHGALLLAALGFLVLALLEVGLWVAVHRLILARIGRMTVATRAFASGNLAARTRPAGQDELAVLGRCFDHMADQIEANLKELRSAHTALQTVIDAIPDGVRVIDSDYRIVLANRAYCAQIGASPDKVPGQFCHRSSHGLDKPCVPTLVSCPVETILERQGGDLTCSHIHRDKDGADLSVEVSAAAVTLLVDGTEKRCVVESIRDMETDLSISQKQRLAEMGSLAAGIAHEVNNPLYAISLALKTIKSQANLSPDMQNYIQIAESEINNCREITESLLRLSALPQTEKELVELTTVIRNTASLLSFEAKQQGVTITLDLQGQPRTLARDSDIRNLVFNLALNAVHAMPDGGDLQLCCKTIHNTVRLTVQDQGVGIPKRDQPKVLLPFWTRRADGSRGRGLGLAICSSIVKSLGGSLTFDSELGVGTCFTIEVPSAGEGQP